MRSHRHPASGLCAALAASASIALMLPALAAAAPPAPGGQHGGGQGRGGPPAGSPGRAGHGPMIQGGTGGHVPSVQGAGRGGHGAGPGPGFQAQLPIFHGYRGDDYHAGQAYSGDRRGFGSVFRSARRFQAGAYRRPEGWYQRRWAYGDILPSIFWAQDYWLTNYWLYDLSPPPYGYVWVRYGNAALLIEESTGRVVEVVYGAFY